MWFGMMDFEHEKDEFLKKPKYYNIGLKGKFRKFIFKRYR